MRKNVFTLLTCLIPPYLAVLPPTLGHTAGHRLGGGDTACIGGAENRAAYLPASHGNPRTALVELLNGGLMMRGGTVAQPTRRQ